MGLTSSAADRARDALEEVYVEAHVWDTVASHAISIPRTKGIIEAPSGRVPLETYILTGSTV